jgi:uncharacterized protein YcaQ
MPQAERRITLETARRLAVTRQHLSGPVLPGTAEGMKELLRDLRCLQLDPISVVARTHELVLFSRLGAFDRSTFEALRWDERWVFEYVAHAASMVLTEDFPLHRWTMRQFTTGAGAWGQRARVWIAENESLRRHILSTIRREGPVPSRALEDLSEESWRSSGWTNERNVSRMLDLLWLGGRILVAGRTGNQKFWDLAERVLPSWTPRQGMTERAVVRRATHLSLRGLGVARMGEIKQHFTRGRYPGLPEMLTALKREGAVVPVSVAMPDGSALPGPWLIHTDELPLVERLEAGEWQPRTTVLSPFDNLVCDRARTERLFDFRYRIEIYVPPPDRVYGYYVLPVLHGDRLIGRIDPVFDRKAERLRVNAVHAEPYAEAERSNGAAVGRAVRDLAVWLGARDVTYEGPVPPKWARALNA